MPANLATALLSSLLLLAALPGQVSASTDNDDLQDTVRFNVSPNGYPPYLIVENDHLGGIVWDVMSRISERLQLTLEPLKIPRKRVDELILNGFVDATPRAVEWTSQPERFLYSDPIVQVEEVLFYPHDRAFEFQSPDDLAGKTLVTHLGYYHAKLAELFESGRTQRFDVVGDAEVFRYLLDSERFDGAIADRLVGRWVIRNHPYMAGALATSQASISNYSLRLMVRPELTGFMHRFNSELTRLKASGELSDILASYR